MLKLAKFKPTKQDITTDVILFFALALVVAVVILTLVFLPWTPEPGYYIGWGV